MLSKTPKNRSIPSGFTLIELLVVITIIAILAGFITSAVFNARIESRDMSRQTDLEQLKLGIKLYKEAYGEYPPYPNGTEIGVGDTIDDDMETFVSKVKGDPLSIDGGGGDYGYWYDSEYDCDGENHVTLMAKNTEKEKFENHADVCGSSGSFARILLVN